MSTPPQSGSFLGHADDDLLSAAVLHHHDRWVHALYFGVQAMEKYLKAQYLTIHEAFGIGGYEAYTQNKPLLHTHDLGKLHRAIIALDPSVVPFPWEDELQHLSELNMATRYPYVIRREGAGMCGSDIELCYLLALHIRPAIVCPQDNYPLAMALRGFRLDEPSSPSPNEPAKLLKELFPDAESLIHWPDRPAGATLVRHLPYMRIGKVVIT